ncbi:MAG: PH domain-containing protein [Planctomycetaceae bacterium]|nr:PH domain-containing protein [Planctomycetaceae bacterium]
MSFDLEPPESNPQPPNDADQDNGQTSDLSTHENQFGANEAAMTPTAEMSFLHPTSLIFDFLAHVKTYILPVAIGLFYGATEGQGFLLIFSAVLVIPTLLHSILGYFTLRYCISDNQLIVREGILNRNIRTVPLARIQNIDSVQNPLHRLLKVAEVKIETASGTKPEAVLRVLSVDKMNSLRSAVFESPAHLAKVSQTNTAVVDLPAVENGHSQTINEFSPSESEDLLKIPLAWLVKAGLASNRGLVLVSISLGVISQFANDKFNFAFSSIGKFIRDANGAPELPDAPQSRWVVIGLSLAAIIIALGLIRLLGVGWYIIRFHGYQLQRNGNDLRISCGLWTKVSASIPIQRIQFISIHRSLLMRWWGLAAIRIETAGGDSSQNENSTESISKRWFIPVIAEDHVTPIIQSLRPDLIWDEANLEFQTVSPRTTNRLVRLACIQTVIVTLTGLAVSLAWGWLPGVILLPLLLARAVKKGKSMQYARRSNEVIYRSGIFNRKTSITFFDKIQILCINQSPFDRRWGMATLCVDTAAAGPAGHRMQIAYLEEQFAHDEFKDLRVSAAGREPVFG